MSLNKFVAGWMCISVLFMILMIFLIVSIDVSLARGGEIVRFCHTSENN